MPPPPNGICEKRWRPATHPLVWAEPYSLPYFGLGHNDQMWMMRPVVVVVGHEDQGDYYLVADGARQP
jgi:hypothetical protein